MKKNKRVFRKFFVKENEDICSVSSKYFDSISREDAIGVAVQTYLELQQQMVRDAMAGELGYIGAVSIADGLRRTLSVLEDKYPFVMKEVRAVSRRSIGQRV